MPAWAQFSIKIVVDRVNLCIVLVYRPIRPRHVADEDTLGYSAGNICEQRNANLSIAPKKFAEQCAELFHERTGSANSMERTRWLRCRFKLNGKEHSIRSERV
jgi:hypothetical protein